MNKPIIFYILLFTCLSVYGNDSILINKQIFNRTRKDDFFYYTYNNTDEKFYSNTTPHDIMDSLAQIETVDFGVYEDRMGYFKKIPIEKVQYNHSYYSIGENC